MLRCVHACFHVSQSKGHPRCWRFPVIYPLRIHSHRFSSSAQARTYRASLTFAQAPVTDPDSQARADAAVIVALHHRVRVLEAQMQQMQRLLQAQTTSGSSSSITNNGGCGSDTAGTNLSITAASLSRCLTSQQSLILTTLAANQQLMLSSRARGLCSAHANW